MRVSSRVSGLSDDDARAMLSGLPSLDDYEVFVTPLRYRTQPHLAALTNLDDRTITVQIPQPFFPFGDVVRYGAVRRPGPQMRFVPLTEGVTFRTPREVVRFLYLHEYMHCFLFARTGRGTSAETTCDRFALLNYAREEVTQADHDDPGVPRGFR